ncbi:unnamed protein product, partial [Durusdinium trenchii]
VSRDGFQREPDKDTHTALYFLGCNGEEVIHHLPCVTAKLTVQRLLRVEDWAAPPMAVLLPSDHLAWGCGVWSMVIARGALEDRPDLRLDMAPRIYLLEDDADLRLWTTSRIDGLDSLGPSESRSQFHNLINFPVGADEACPSQCLGTSWSLWAPDLQFVARVSNGKLWYWRCDVAYADSLMLLNMAC